MAKDISLCLISMVEESSTSAAKRCFVLTLKPAFQFDSLSKTIGRHSILIIDIADNLDTIFEYIRKRLTFTIYSYCFTNREVQTVIQRAIKMYKLNHLGPADLRRASNTQYTQVRSGSNNSGGNTHRDLPTGGNNSPALSNSQTMTTPMKKITVFNYSSASKY